MSASPELPGTWTWASLESLASNPKRDIVDGPFGSNLKASEYVESGVPIIRLQNVAPNQFVQKNIRFITRGKAAELSRHSFRAGDIVITKLGDPLGEACMVPEELGSGIIVADIVRARLSEELSKKAVVYAINSITVQSQLKAITKGTTRPRVNLGHIREMLLPIPPRAEQDRIVAEIEKQFTRLDDAVAALKRVQANLKRYRASVLKAACEGLLVPTEAELARKEGRDYEPASNLLKRVNDNSEHKRAGRLWGSGVVPDLSLEERERLPEGWTWTKVRYLGKHPEATVQVGPMSMRSQDFEQTGVPVLNVGCVQWARFNEEKLDFMPEHKAASFARYAIEPGDILFTRSGTVGRCAVAQQHQAGWLMTFHLLRVRTVPSTCIPEYLRTVFEGADHIRRQRREASIGTTRAGFNTNLLAELDVPLPPLAEQRRILGEVDRRLAFTQKLEAEVDAALRRAEQVRKATLAAAFSGKLVPQDPNDEPASVLLERIRAERARAQEQKQKTPQATNAASSVNGRRTNKLVQPAKAGKG